MSAAPKPKRSTTTAPEPESREHPTMPSMEAVPPVSPATSKAYDAAERTVLRTTKGNGSFPWDMIDAPHDERTLGDWLWALVYDWDQGGGPGDFATHAIEGLADEMDLVAFGLRLGETEAMAGHERDVAIRHLRRLTIRMRALGEIHRRIRDAEDFEARAELAQLKRGAQ